MSIKYETRQTDKLTNRQTDTIMVKIFKASEKVALRAAFLLKPLVDLKFCGNEKYFRFDISGLSFHEVLGGHTTGNINNKYLKTKAGRKVGSKAQGMR